jgi:hypothetical protein
VNSGIGGFSFSTIGLLDYIFARLLKGKKLNQYLVQKEKTTIRI